MEKQIFKKITQFGIKRAHVTGDLGWVKKRTPKRRVLLAPVLLTICKNSTVAMGGVRAEAHITCDGEGRKGFLYLPHL